MAIKKRNFFGGFPYLNTPIPAGDLFNICHPWMGREGSREGRAIKTAEVLGGGWRRGTGDVAAKPRVRTDMRDWDEDAFALGARKQLSPLKLIIL